MADQGKGFDAARLLDCCADAGLLASSGRGVFLMRSLMDEVVFSSRPEGGTIVRLRKRRSPAPGSVDEALEPAVGVR